MKVHSSFRFSGCLRHMAGASFGLLNVPCPKIGRPVTGKGLTTVITGAQGAYFIPRGQPAFEDK